MDMNTQTNGGKCKSSFDEEVVQDALYTGKRAGVAHIKKLFLLPNDTLHLDELSSTHLGDSSNKNIEEASPNLPDNNLSKVSADLSAGDSCFNSGGNQHFPNKRAKVRGRNKQRPITFKNDRQVKVCPSVVAEQDCLFGEKCQFRHDVCAYMESKPPDIGPVCSRFSNFGHCPFGITCRYAGHHLTSDLKNITNLDVSSVMCKCGDVQNALSKDLQHILWKKKYNFSKADNITDTFINVEKHNIGCITATYNSNASESSYDLLNEKATGCVLDSEEIILKPSEKKLVDFSNKLYLAPLTTVGNLPFRRLCKQFGADITCGEMAMATSLLQGHQNEWALLKRYRTEDIFGVQICGGNANCLTRCAQLLQEQIDVDFVDINCGCPIDLVFNKGEGCALMAKQRKLVGIARCLTSTLDVPLTVKMRTGIVDGKNTAHSLIPQLREAGVSVVTVHGRSRQQRYTRKADWQYIEMCAKIAHPMPLMGNGDIMSYEEAALHQEASGVKGLMIARGALIKPWIFTEIKEQRHWDISSSERFDMLRTYCNFGLEHWGSDTKGVENTRRFLLEWLSFLYRYIPVGVLEHLPQKINERPPHYKGRDDLETLMASSNCADWIKISEMLLGPVPPQFMFLPKHKANSYQ